MHDAVEHHENNAHANPYMIVIVDMPGFEAYETENTIQQLAYNYTAEVLLNLALHS